MTFIKGNRKKNTYSLYHRLHTVLDNPQFSRIDSHYQDIHHTQIENKHFYRYRNATLDNIQYMDHEFLVNCKHLYQLVQRKLLYNLIQNQNDYRFRHIHHTFTHTQKNKIIPRYNFKKFRLKFNLPKTTASTIFRIEEIFNCIVIIT